MLIFCKKLHLSLSVFLIFFCFAANAQTNNHPRIYFQTWFVVNNFILPKNIKQTLNIRSTATIDSLFSTIETAWKKAAPDTLKKYNVDIPLKDFYNIDAYCYYWTLASLTGQIDLPPIYQNYLVDKYMIPAMRRDYETLKNRANYTSIQLIHYSTLGKTLMFASDDNMSKETILAGYKLYEDFGELFKSLYNNADKSVGSDAKNWDKYLENFKYELNAKHYYNTDDIVKAYEYTITGLNVNNYSAASAFKLSKKLIDFFIADKDNDRSFALLNTLLINTTPDVVNRDTLVALYLKTDSLNGKKIYENQLSKLSVSAFKKSELVIKLPKDWNFLSNSINNDKLGKAKYFLVDFWYTSCEPCRADIPYLNALNEKLKSRNDIALIAINTDYNNGKYDRAYVVKMIKQLNINVPVIYDNDNIKLNKQLSITGYPAKFIINKEGEVLVKTNDSKIDIDAFELFMKETNKE